VKTEGGLTEGMTSEHELVAACLIPEGADSKSMAKLERGTLTVGSGSGVDLRVEDRSVSRLHASFELLTGGVRVRDLGSRNGTFYLGARIETVVVPVGASVVLGRLTVRIAPLLAEPNLELTADPPSPLVGASKAIRRLSGLMKKLARSEATLLIEGASGTGKELIARAIHNAWRPSSPFVVFDCAAVSPNLIESELFGVTRGAFTGADRARAGVFEQALDGTVLIDEPASLPIDLQPKLLRVLESREFRRIGDSLVRKTTARFMATSRVSLESEVQAGRFREDLFYRLSSVRLEVPPLAQRREDIPVLAQHFAAVHGVRLPASTVAAMQCHHWPGNVRELKGAIERTLLKLDAPLQTPTTSKGEAPSFLEARDQLVSEFEREFVRALLTRHRGNISAAAREAKLARSFFYRLIEKHGLSSAGG
jgi:DNA-binding NtrC family response regulator